MVAVDGVCDDECDVCAVRVMMTVKMSVCNRVTWKLLLMVGIVSTCVTFQRSFQYVRKSAHLLNKYVICDRHALNGV